MVLLVNQHTIPVFTDVVNAYAGKEKVVLFTGSIEKGGAPLSKEVQIVRSKAYDRKTTISRFFSWLFFTVHYAMYLCFIRKPTLILVVTNPPLAPMVTAIIAGLRSVRFRVLIYDLYPDALSQAGLAGKESILYRLWARVNRYAFSKAERIFTLSESMKEATTKYVDEAGRIDVIHNWADTSYVSPVPRERNPFVAKHCLGSKLVVMYAGNMGLTHDFQSLIDAATILQKESNIIFILIGDGAQRISLQSVVKSRSLANVLFLPYQDEQAFPFAMAAADIGVVTLGKGGEGISVPSKTYVNLAAGVCLLAIAPRDSELCRIVDVYEAGVTCEPAKAEEVARLILHLRDNTTELARLKANALKASTKYTSENAFQYLRGIA